MPSTDTPSKKTNQVLLRLTDEEHADLVARAGRLQAEEREERSVQDVIRRACFPDRYPSLA